MIGHHIQVNDRERIIFFKRNNYLVAKKLVWDEGIMDYTRVWEKAMIELEFSIGDFIKILSKLE